MRAIEVETTSGEMMGRNGNFAISSVIVEQYDGFENVYIVAISRKKKVELNGGLSLTATAMTELAKRFLEERGYEVTEKC